jgi:WD40 repeat protein
MGVLRAAFFPDGKTLATGGLDGKVKLWNLITQQEVVTLPLPLGGSFRSLCISPDERTLAVGYMGFPGHHVRMFHAPSFEEIAAAEKDRIRTFQP